MACTNPGLKTAARNDGGRGSVTPATSGGDEGHFEVAEEPNMASLKNLRSSPCVLLCRVSYSGRRLRLNIKGKEIKVE